MLQACSASSVTFASLSEAEIQAERDALLAEFGRVNTECAALKEKIAPIGAIVNPPPLPGGVLLFAVQLHRPAMRF